VAKGGRRVLVLEASDLVGGAAAYSGGQVWCGANHVEARLDIDDDLERTEAYVRGIAHGCPELLDEAAMLRWLRTSPSALKYWEQIGAIRWEVIRDFSDYHDEVEGALSEGRYLTNEIFDGRILGEWRSLLRVSPYFPVGMTYSEMLTKGRRQSKLEEGNPIAQHAGMPAFGLPDSRASLPASDNKRDPLTFGTGVVAGFLSCAVKEELVKIQLSSRVTELLLDGGEVVGVRVEGPQGIKELRGAVVLATSTFDWNEGLVREMLGLEPQDYGSVAPPTLRGDAISMVRKIGGGIVKFPPTVVPMLPGWRSEAGEGYGYGPEYALPHSIIVDLDGKRYCDDSFWVDIVAKTLDPADTHLPFFLIWDDQHRAKYGLGVTPPGGRYPDGLVHSAPDLASLADLLGVSADGLVDTVARFNPSAAVGDDPDWGRGTVSVVRRFAGDPSHLPNPVLGPIEQVPFYGMRLRFVGTGIGTSGVHIDGDGRVLDESCGPIPGLYAVGSCAAHTNLGTGYNSGMALGRGLTLAYLVSSELVGAAIS